MKIKLDRIISVATLLAAVVAITLVLKKPAPVAQQPQAAAGFAANSPSSNTQPISQKSDQFEPARAAGAVHATITAQRGYFAAPQAAQNSLAPPSPKLKRTPSSDGIGSAISQSLSASAGGAAALTPDSDAGSGAPNIKDQKSTMTEIPFTGIF